MAEICLIDPPWSSIRTPSIQVGIIKSLLTESGLCCRDEYLNLRWHKFCVENISEFDASIYREISESRGGFGEWVFSLWPKSSDAEVQSRSIVPPIDARISARGYGVLQELRNLAPAFVQVEVQRLLAEGCRIFGLTTTFAQTSAALAFAYELKRASPETLVVLGGANCTGKMGETLAEMYPWIDIVFQGEAEGRVVDLFADLVAGKAIRDTSGLVFKGAKVTGSDDLSLKTQAPSVLTFKGTKVIDSGVLSLTTQTQSVPSMDEHPIPDFAGYFAELTGVKQAEGDRVQLVYETSRGCWWGERKHCTFCGLNASSMAFRSKSGAKVVAELDLLARKYGVIDFQIVDNILDHKYFQTVMPALQERNYRLFWEVKASLRREQVEALAQAGVREVQPGIESLHAVTLKNMQKGVTPLTNIRFLKWCLRYGVSPVWLVMYNLPGDEPEFYHEQAMLIPLIVHLPPPALVRLELQRFSPYWNDPAKYGIVIHGAHRSYEMIHDATNDQLANLAYEFEYSHPNQHKLENSVGELRQAIQIWIDLHQDSAPPLLAAKRNSDQSIRIDDSRAGQAVSYTLDAETAQVIEMCDAGIRRVDLLTRSPDVEGIVDELLAKGIIILLRDKLLSLVT